MIRRFFIVIYLLSISNIIFAIETGFYIAPRFMFGIQNSGTVPAKDIIIENIGGLPSLPDIPNLPEIPVPTQLDGVDIDFGIVSNFLDNTTNVNNIYYGGGFAFGYNFYAYKNNIPVRLELEYIYQEGASMNKYAEGIKTMNIHTFMIGGYYDFNFLKIEDESANTNVYKDGKRDVMSVYLGVVLGGGFNQYISYTVQEILGFISVSHYENKFNFYYGPSVGIAFNATTFLTFDIGYRFILDLNTKFLHNILLGFRLNF